MTEKQPSYDPNDIDLIDMIRHPEKYQFEETPIQKRIREQYASVPEANREVWLRSDDSEAYYKTRSAACEKLEAALVDLITICQEIRSQKGPMTPKLKAHYELPLATAIHLAEEVLENLDGGYPLPDKNKYTRVRNNTNLLPYAPKLLQNTEQQILIWLHSLPQRSIKSAGMIYWEIYDFLSEYFLELHRFPDWHCDFIHVHPPETWAGILDADNYIYKPIIDDLTVALRTKDSYDRFSYSAYNLASDRIPAGCYIRVTKRSEKVGFFRDFEEQVIALENAENAYQMEE